jgi:restriction endonuclease S subunit
VNSTPKQPTIKDLVQIRAGYQTRKEVKSTPSGTHSLLQIRDFNEERTEIDLKNITRIEPGQISEDQVLREGDVIFLSKGARNFSFAPSALPDPALAASYFFILRPARSIAPDYLAWFLNLETTKNLLRKYATHGAHMPVIRRDVLEDLEIPLPDLETQRKIVELAALAERQHRLLAELAAMKKLLATAACLRAANQSSTHTHR